MFLVIYFGYVVIYQKVAYPGAVNPWYADALHYMSFSSLFYGFYFAVIIFLRNKDGKNLDFIAYLLIGIISFFTTQHIKNYYIFEIKSGLFDYYLMQVPEIFLMSVFAVIFAQIEYSVEINELKINNLRAKSEKEFSRVSPAL